MEGGYGRGKDEENKRRGEEEDGDRYETRGKTRGRRQRWIGMVKERDREEDGEGVG